jgi:hypothetical protein
MDSADTAISPSPSFMTLPAEIRIMIYQAVLVHARYKCTNVGDTVVHEVLSTDVTTIRRLNKQIRREVLPLIHTMPTALGLFGWPRKRHKAIPNVSMRRICSITTDEPYRFSRGLLKWLNIRDHPHLRHIVFLGPALIIPAASLRALIQSSLRRGIRQFKLNPSHLAYAHILRTCPVSPATILDMVRNRRVTLKFACKFSYRIHSPIARSTALARGVCITATICSAFG